MNKNSKQFLEAISSLVETKGLSEEIIVQALETSFKSTFNKKLSDDLLIINKAKRNKGKKDSNIKIDKTNKLPDALIDCFIDLKKGKIKIVRKWEIVKEDDLEDDFIQISELDEIVTSNKKLKLGDFFEEPLDYTTLTKGYVEKFISTYKQIITLAEKESVLSMIEPIIGKLTTVEVDKCDKHSVIVNLNKTTVTMYRKDLIGKEDFKQGENIKVYVCGILKDAAKGNSLIHCSRTCPEFLGKLFENEVHEIYDGTVKIAKIARVAGQRSKVAVYSEDSNVDATGACIGANGGRIQAVVSQLGNDRNSKEKIDVIDYSENVGVLLRESLKPGQVIGIKIDNTPNGDIATVVCTNETKQAAIGLKGINVILSKQLTGLKEINIIDETEAEENKVNYTLMEVYEEEAKELLKNKFRERSLEYAKKNYGDIEIIDTAKTENNSIKNEIEEEIESPVSEQLVEKELETSKEPVDNKKIDEEIEEEIKIAPVKKTKVEEPVEYHEVKTTTTLDELEASLESVKNSDKNQKNKFNKKKKKASTNNDDELSILSNVKSAEKMSIYTEQELEELEQDDDFDFDLDDEDDYSDYDTDEYYEDN